MKVILWLVACWTTISFDAHTQDIDNDFEKLHLLVGTWRMRSANGSLYESWKKMNDSAFAGCTYKVSGVDTVVLEQVNLIKKGASIQYIPLAKGQNNNQPVVFTLSRTEKGIYTFENTAHDFPQRIVYTLPQGNSMHAGIEGEINGKFRKVDYNYTRDH